MYILLGFGFDQQQRVRGLFEDIGKKFRIFFIRIIFLWCSCYSRMTKVVIFLPFI